jgi:hypothetical protein
VHSGDRDRPIRPIVIMPLALAGLLLFGAIPAQAGIRYGDLPGTASAGASVANTAG